MIQDPARRGRVLAEFFLALEPRLFSDLAEAVARHSRLELAADGPAREEWRCFALYACVRGLVAAGGFNRETADAIEALHERVLGAWSETSTDPSADSGRRALVADRYAEYGAIGQAGGAPGTPGVPARLGSAAARRIAGGGPAVDTVARIVGALHEALFEGATEAVRTGS